ncbi:MAG TPA: SDR family NAD(P)-dependent oxidoreductase, partial [Casimicrobiaceae bacterium]|nr:SDR family NAD(P)-dependent oxidoreductase [Casimicrobiaceae bacterium]
MTDSIAPDLPGKSVLITGASTGIGAAAARAFALAGSRVAIHYNASLNRAEEVAADVRFAGAEAFIVGGDLRSSTKARDVVAAAAGHFGGLDILVNNAGGLVQRRPVTEIDDTFFDEVIDLNVRSLVAASAAAVPH